MNETPLRVTLTELGHTQPPTSLQADNSTAFGILNDTIKQKQSKAMDMRYHWLTDRVRQKQFDDYWRPGREKLGDYHTKHTAFIIGTSVQWLFPNSMAWFALPMSRKSPWDKFLGERLRALAGTHGGAALLAAGVTTLGGSDEFGEWMTWAGEVGVTSLWSCLIHWPYWGCERLLDQRSWAFIFCRLQWGVLSFRR
jgi:hypothetical protein